jgi:ferredoxin-type protein NapH
MTTIKIRRALLFLFFLLTPLLQFYFSPIIPFFTALGGGIAISLFVFLSLGVIGMFFGRAPCGWVMLCGGLQESCFYVNDRRIAAGKKDRVKYVLWAIWLSSLLLVLWSHASTLHLDLFFGIEHGISMSRPQNFIIYYGILLPIVVICFIFGKRPLCHCGCWIAPFMVLGRKLGNALRLPGLRLKANPQQCVGCKTCTKVCPMGLEVEQMVKSGKVEHAECILCAECSHACKAKALQLTFGRN